MKNVSTKYLFLTLYFISLLIIAFYIERTSIYLLFLLVSVSFLSYYNIFKYKISLKEIFIFGLILRVVFLVTLPSLSDDYFRFIWDGKLSLEGVSPFKYLPSEFIKLTSRNYFLDLYSKLNSPNYYSVYPPVSQCVYLIGALFDKTIYSVILIRIVLIISDLFSFFYIRKLLNYFGKDENLSYLYFLNPLVIIEITGNLHFEGLMLLFLLISVHLFLHAKYSLSALFFSIAVGVKLLPLMFLPLFVFKLPKDQKINYLFFVGISLLILFAPFINIELLKKMMTSVTLYFQTFEFNASFHYIFRWIGYQIYGYNIIKELGVYLGVISMCSILLLSFKYNKKPFFNVFLLLNVVYLIFSTTIHPWYLVLPLAFSVFTSYRFVILWSFTIFLSYATYQSEVYKENLVLVALEYLLIFMFFIYEIRKNVSFFHS